MYIKDVIYSTVGFMCKNQWEFREIPYVLLASTPRNYGSIADEKVELNGLLYVIERLPIKGLKNVDLLILLRMKSTDPPWRQAQSPP